jgi:hypothetical protein
MLDVIPQRVLDSALSLAIPPASLFHRLQGQQYQDNHETLLPSGGYRQVAG